MSSSAIVLGASAGGVEALRAVVAGLPPDLPAPVVVVLHIPRRSPTALPGILDRSGPLPAVPVARTTSLRDGVVHVAPADHHVLLVDGTVRLSTGPAENGHRPAIDPLFRSAALAYRQRAIGVVLSGTRDDGSAGLAAIAAAGGVAVVQDPADAGYGGMPASALGRVPDALVHPAALIGVVLADLVRRLPPEVGAALPRAADDRPGTGSPATGRTPEEEAELVERPVADARLSGHHRSATGHEDRAAARTWATARRVRAVQPDGGGARPAAQPG